MAEPTKVATGGLTEGSWCPGGTCAVTYQPFVLFVIMKRGIPLSVRVREKTGLEHRVNRGLDTRRHVGRGKSSLLDSAHPTSAYRAAGGVRKPEAHSAK